MAPVRVHTCVTVSVLTPLHRPGESLPFSLDSPQCGTEDPRVEAAERRVLPWGP